MGVDLFVRGVCGFLQGGKTEVGEEVTTNERYCQHEVERLVGGLEEKVRTGESEDRNYCICRNSGPLLPEPEEGLCMSSKQLSQLS